MRKQYLVHTFLEKSEFFILIYFLFSDEAREKQIPPNDQLQNGSTPCISTGGTESNTDSTSNPGFQSSETQSMVFIRTTSEFSFK